VTGLGVNLRPGSCGLCGRRLGANKPHGVSHLFLLGEQTTGLGNDENVKYQNEDRHETADQQLGHP